MAEQLQDNGNEVRIGNVVLRTPGLSGTVEIYEPIAFGTRAMDVGGGTAPELLAALQNTRTIEQMTIELSGTLESPAAAAVEPRRDRFDEAMIEVEVPDAGETFGQFILATDESGFVSWHLPKTGTNQIDTTRGAARRTYLIPRRVAPAPPAGEATRGILGVVGRKILKVIAFPILDPLIGHVTDYFVGKWEKRNRPYGVRVFTSGNYQQPHGEAIEGDAWTALSAGKALLFIHGTFSRAHAAFAGIAPDTMRRLEQLYGGRVFAFEHPTLGDDPKTNVAWLLERIPRGIAMQVDVVCHSRGGLVTRELVRANDSRLAVRKVIFGATPNAGTVLTDAAHMGAFIDTYTNMLGWLPSNGVTDVLEAIVTVVKQLAVGALKGLEGLQSMLPGGAYLAGLPAVVGTADCYAISSDFEPLPASPVVMRTADLVVDKIFDHVANDLVVPTDGVYSWGGTSLPAAKLHVFKGEDAPVHTAYFQHPVTQQLLLRWLP